MAKITALVIDGLPVSRCNLREALRREPDVLILGEAAGGAEALELARQLKPDVILLSVGLGWPLARQLHRENNLSAVILLTARADSSEARHSFRAGGAAYCRQDVSAHTLIQVLRQVAQGHYVLDGQVFDKEGLQARLALRARCVPPPDRFGQALSRRELDILQCLTQGLSNKEIALALGISNQTVKNHMTSLLGKLRAFDRTQLAVYALRHGLVHLHDT